MNSKTRANLAVRKQSRARRREAIVRQGELELRVRAWASKPWVFWSLSSVGAFALVAGPSLLTSGI